MVCLRNSINFLPQFIIIVRKVMFGFTKREKIVVVFLIIVLLIGTGIISVQKLVFEKSAGKYKVKYAQLDNRFAALEKQDSLIVQSKKGKQTLININTATQRELIKLPGIGPKLSERIIQYRKDTGRFKTKRDIIKIKGIGEKKIEKILPLICIEN